MKIDLNRMFVDDETREAVLEVLESGRYVKGPKAAGFEEGFADLIGDVRCVSCSSGSTALMLAFSALGIGPGDEVIVPSHTFIASINGFYHYGARPVFVDIDPETYTMDPQAVRDAVTEKTRAILPVHIYGHPADMDPILSTGEKHGIPVIGDAAQAHGAEYKGADVGKLGLMTCYSFFPSKIITVAGEGGMISVKNEKLHRDLAALRNHGRYPGERDVSTVAGFNMRLPEINAAVGCVQLRHMPEWIERRREIARVYNEELQGVGDLILPVERSWGKHVYYLYVVRSSRRDELQKFLKEKGIASGVHYRVPAHRMPYMGEVPDLPVTDRIVDEILSLPMHPLLSGEEQGDVIKAVREFFEG